MEKQKMLICQNNGTAAGVLLKKNPAGLITSLPDFLITG